MPHAAVGEDGVVVEQRVKVVGGVGGAGMLWDETVGDFGRLM